MALRRQSFTLAALAIVVVVRGERFLAEPQDSVVSQGQLHILMCSIEDRIGQVQWLRNGFGLGPGTEFEGYPRYRVQENSERGEYHLMISNIQLEDDGIFECQVGATSFTKGLQSHKAKLSVQIPPESVTTEGGSVVQVVADMEYTLVCHANGGKPAPIVTWESLGEQLVDGLTSSVTMQSDGKREDVTSRLTILPHKTDEGRVFECQAINPATIEVKRASLRLQVLYKPEVTMTTSTKSQVKEYARLKFSCSAVGNPNIITWRWYLGNNELPGEVGTTLDLAHVTREHHGKTVACEARNKVNATQQTFTFNVEYGPRFVSEPVNQAADVGDIVTLSCDVDSNPPAAVVWRRKGVPRVLSSSSTYQITRVSFEQFATYTCTASVSGYEEISRDVLILKKGPPRMKSLTQQSAWYGDTGIVECIIESVPKPTRIVWTKNGQNIDFTNSKRYQVREEDIESGRRSVLEIMTVQDQDFTTYNCSAENDYGLVYQPITFSKREIVPLPYILAGVLGGVLIIIIIIIVVFIYHRRRSNADTESTSSDDSTKKVKQTPDIKIEYSANTVDVWDQGLLDPRYPHHPVEYDELHYPLMDPGIVPGPDGYGYMRQPDPYIVHPVDSLYGTYPRGIGYAHNPRVDANNGPVHGSDTYATYGRAPELAYDFRPYIPHPPASPTDSRLSTNV